MKLIYTSALSCLFLLAGCSPHTATGYWNASSENSSDLTKVVVRFEARMEVYAKDPEKAKLYCGWSASGKQSLSLECMASEDINDKEIYQFNVTDDTAELVYKDEVIGIFTRQPQ